MVVLYVLKYQLLVFFFHKWIIFICELVTLDKLNLLV